MLFAIMQGHGLFAEGFAWVVVMVWSGICLIKLQAGRFVMELETRG